MSPDRDPASGVPSALTLGAWREVGANKRPALACSNGEHDVCASIHPRTWAPILFDDDGDASSRGTRPNGHLRPVAQVPTREQPERLGDGLAP